MVARNQRSSFINAYSKSNILNNLHRKMQKALVEIEYILAVLAFVTITIAIIENAIFFKPVTVGLILSYLLFDLSVADDAAFFGVDKEHTARL